MLVQLFIIYHGLAQFEAIRNSFLWVFLREPFWCAIIAFSLNVGAYTAEILRGGIQGVDRGLHEAGRALGLKPHQRFIHVTAPIAVRLSLPAYGNEIISFLKGTALVSLITMCDVTGVARTIMARTFAPYEIFLSAGDRLSVPDLGDPARHRAGRAPFQPLRPKVSASMADATRPIIRLNGVDEIVRRFPGAQRVLDLTVQIGPEGRRLRALPARENRR